MLQKFKPLLDKVKKSENFLIGITGLPGSGKTALSEILSKLVDRTYENHQVIYLGADLYMTYPRNKKILKVKEMISPKDYWSIFRLGDLIEDIKKLKSKTSFNRGSLYRRDSGQLNHTIKIDISEMPIVALIEGMQVVHPKIYPYFDTVIFVDETPETCLKRKQERATYRSPDESRWLFKSFEEPAFNIYRKNLLGARNVIKVSDVTFSLANDSNDSDYEL